MKKRFFERGQQELEMMLKFYLQYIKLSPTEKDSYSDHNNDTDVRTMLYMFVSSLRGYDMKPEIVDAETYEKLEHSLELYHGWKETFHAKNFLESDDYHIGKGAYGSGFYCTESRENGVYFTQSHSQKTYSKSRVMPLKITTENGIDSKLLYKLCYKMETGQKITKDIFKDLSDGVIEKCNRLQDFIDSIEEPEIRHGFKLALFGSDDDENSSAFLAYLGIDYIERPRMYGDASHIQILNRGAVIVEEGVYNHFTSAFIDQDEIDEDELYGF